MGMRVLVVDDDAEIARLVGQVAKSTGATVAVAPNAREALRMADRDHPDLILLDVMMPGMDGVSVLAEVRRRPSLNATRVVMLTASQVTPELTDRLGADGFVRKPFSFTELRAAIVGRD